MNEGPVVHIRKYLSFQLAAYFKSYLLSVPSKAFYLVVEINQHQSGENA